jgi:hypothetical protein
MIGFVIFELALWTASFVYHYWPRDAKQPPPGAIGGVPRTDEGAPLPLIYGRCRVRAPVLAWIGNWRVNFSSANSAGYQADMLFVMGVPFYGGGAALQQIFAGNFRLSLVPTPPGPGGTDRRRDSCRQPTRQIDVQLDQRRDRLRRR